nr:unnamed protein product [Digitaria exilis]
MGTWQQETRACLNKDGAEDTCWAASKREEPDEPEAVGGEIVAEKQKLVEEHAILAAAVLHTSSTPLPSSLPFLWTPDTVVFHPLVFSLSVSMRWSSSLSCSPSSWAWAGTRPKRKKEITFLSGVNWHAAAPRPRRHQQR